VCKECCRTKLLSLEEHSVSLTESLACDCGALVEPFIVPPTWEQGRISLRIDADLADRLPGANFSSTSYPDRHLLAQHGSILTLPVWLSAGTERSAGQNPCDKPQG